MRTVAIVGKNFGDEGKGLATDCLAMHADRPMVVRHNGGAQSGHTVEIKKAGGKRFVFHELSSGSFRGADTLWISGFYPDLYKLGDEVKAFRAAFGVMPTVYAEEDTCVTVPDDVLLNMALESSRGDRRHGSCGMGINECDLRTGAGYGLSLRAVSRMNADALYHVLAEMRKAYTAKRLKEIGPKLTQAASAYLQYLSNENVLKNAAAAMIDHLRYVHLLDEASLKETLRRVGTLIFESGQGLLLDRGNEAFAPHVTASDTGIRRPLSFLERIGGRLDEAVYVSRTYVTRHGAGALPCECPKDRIGHIGQDMTNEPNEWQGALRYACHEDAAGFTAYVRQDLRRLDPNDVTVSLFLTHLNETDHTVAMKDGYLPIDTFVKLPEISDTFDRLYLSDSHFAEDVKQYDLPSPSAQGALTDG